jgi:16S rRNA (cytosine967-C5)-methyltransferase
VKAAARLSAAIEVLDDVGRRHRPVADALKDWGLSHRFAGSGDRTAIGNLVFDALRRRASLAWRMRSEEPRALVLGAFRYMWGTDVDALEAMMAEDRHAPAPLSEDERAALGGGSLDGAPDWVRADLPEWLAPALSATFGDRLVAEGEAFAARAPVDLRANTLKATRDKVVAALERFAASPTPLSPVGVRLPVGEGPARPPHVQSEAGYAKGWFEIQDEGSQIAALLAGARPGGQVLDLCAGAGGKTLAMAAEMGNRGQIYAHDADRRRFGDIYERLDRAGVHNVQVRPPDRPGVLDDLDGRMDVVLVDAPCTGSGTWRRRPDAKWRLRENALSMRLAEQAALLETAARFVRPGGRLVYVTCSVLAEENELQVVRFLEAGQGFSCADPAASWIAALGTAMPDAFAAAVGDEGAAVRLTPASAGTDGFFVAVLERQS